MFYSYLIVILWCAFQFLSAPWILFKLLHFCYFEWNLLVNYNNTFCSYYSFIHITTLKCVDENHVFFYLSGDLAFACQIWGRVRTWVMSDNGNWVITIQTYIATWYLDRVMLCKHCCAVQYGMLSETTICRLKIFLRPDERHIMVNENMRTWCVRYFGEPDLTVLLYVWVCEMKVCKPLH